MLASALALGLLGSLHCVGMCGPIALLLPVDRTNGLRKFTQILSYHLGRTLAYALMGLIFGFLGKGLYVFGLQQKLSLIIGIIMILLVLLPYSIARKYSFSKPIYGVISRIKSKLGSELQKKTADTFLTIGFLNGFLPCGLVYMALFGAIAMGNPAEGALYMALFGLGTAPLMTAAIYFSGMLKHAAKRKIQKLIPVFVIIIGALFVLRGLGLGIPYVSPKPVVELVSSDLECHN